MKTDILIIDSIKNKGKFEQIYNYFNYLHMSKVLVITPDNKHWYLLT